MKKVILVYLLLIASFILLVMFGFGNQTPDFITNLLGRANSPVAQNTTATANINSQQIDLLIANNDELRIQGLSGRESLEENQGMLFIFEEKGEYGFWMRDMLFPIDIIFLEDNKVVNIHENAAPSDNPNDLEVYYPTKPINQVLELNAGKAQEMGIKAGTEITLEGI